MGNAKIKCLDNGYTIVSTVASSCKGCRGCSEPRPILVRLPEIHLPTVLTRIPEVECKSVEHYASEVEISATPGDQFLLAGNSLLLPLLGFVCGCLISSLLGVGDGGQISGAISGFVVGVLFCKPQDFSRISVEVLANE